MNWRHSLLGKVAAFIMLGVFIAYIVGAGAGFVVLDGVQREQWRNQAEFNAQIASSVVRGVFTSVVVHSNPSGQVTSIVSDFPIGNDSTILFTGYNPSDVLALVAAQTRHDVWFFAPVATDGSFVSTAESRGHASGTAIVFEGAAAPRPDRAAFYVGNARIGGTEHMVSALPVIGTDGAMQGLLVTSIGRTADLLSSRNEMAFRALFALLVVLAFTAALVAVLMRRLFRPVPVLIESLKRIADNDTGVVTPFTGRDDEIGQLADAIETLREAVVEREHLREAREATLQFEYMAHHDSLTGLPNRAHLNKRLDEVLETARTGRPINFLMFDLDRFKAVNDTHGHAVGDVLLTAVASRILLLLGPDDLAARLGGDEFAIIQNVARDAEVEGRRLGERIVEMLGAPFVIGDLELVIGASVGVTRAPIDGTTPHEILTRADIALYASKHRGRGTYALFQKGMDVERRRMFAAVS